MNAPLESDLQLYRDLQAGALTTELSRKYFDYIVYFNLYPFDCETRNCAYKM